MIIEGLLADMARNMGHPVFTHFFVRANRRWSMIGTRSEQREKLEGSPLNVCLDCKEMVLQVRYIWYFDYAVTRRYGLSNTRPLGTTRVPFITSCSRRLHST